MVRPAPHSSVRFLANPSAMQSTYKPSPLSVSSPSPRASPFRRQGSPAPSSLAPSSGTATPTPIPQTTSAPSVTSPLCGTTPTPAYASTRPLTPSKLAQSRSFTDEQPAAAVGGRPGGPYRAATSGPLSPPPAFNLPSAARAPSGHGRANSVPVTGNFVASPRSAAGGDGNGVSVGRGGLGAGATDALARLPPAQVREMREAFQILDRDSDGHVTRADVAETLSGLGNISPLLTFSSLSCIPQYDSNQSR